MTSYFAQYFAAFFGDKYERLILIEMPSTQVYDSCKCSFRRRGARPVKQILATAKIPIEIGKASNTILLFQF
jgi:hypothetical protein